MSASPLKPRLGAVFVMAVVLSGSAAAGSGDPEPTTAGITADTSLAIPGCPRAQLLELLSGVTEQSDIISAFAIEQETLKLCRERQKLVTEIYQLEQELKALSRTAQPDEVRKETPPPSMTAAAPKPEQPAPHQRYAWFSIIGIPGALRAGISDGKNIWYVREGDSLPGSVIISTIASRPPRVQVGRDGWPLPWSPRPSGDGS